MIRKCEHVSSILRRWKEGYSVAPRHLFVEKYRTLCLIKREGGPRAARQADVIHKCGVSSMISVPAGAANSGMQRCELSSMSARIDETKK
jgi:hypothetical protein